MNFLKSYLGFIVVVLFAYFGIGIAFTAERLRNDPLATIRKALMLTFTWGKYLFKGRSHR